MEPTTTIFAAMSELPDIYSYLITDEDWALAEKKVRDSGFYGNEHTISPDPDRLIYAACAEIAALDMLPYNWQKQDISSSTKSDIKALFTNGEALIEVKVRMRTDTNIHDYYDYGYEERQHSDYFKATHICFFHMNKRDRFLQLVGIMTADDWRCNAKKSQKGAVDTSNNFVEHASEYKMTAENIRRLSVHDLFINPKNNLNPNQIMSTYQKKDGDISVFTNHSDNANAPAWKGNLLLNGIEYQVSLWRKQGAKGEFLAGNVQQKQQSAERPAQAQSYTSKPEPHGNDLPF